MSETKTILMVDDEVDFLSTTQFLLESAHFKVITASTPEEGLRKALLNPDLILLDINMPGMDGLTVCKRLKEDKATSHIPIIMLTLNASTMEKVAAFDFGEGLDASTVSKDDVEGVVGFEFDGRALPQPRQTVGDRFLGLTVGGAFELVAAHRASGGTRRCKNRSMRVAFRFVLVRA